MEFVAVLDWVLFIFLKEIVILPVQFSCMFGRSEIGAFFKFIILGLLILSLFF